MCTFWKIILYGPRYWSRPGFSWCWISLASPYVYRRGYCQSKSQHELGTKRGMFFFFHWRLKYQTLIEAERKKRAISPGQNRVNPKSTERKVVLKLPCLHAATSSSSLLLPLFFIGGGETDRPSTVTGNNRIFRSRKRNGVGARDLCMCCFVAYSVRVTFSCRPAD